MGFMTAIRAQDSTEGTRGWYTPRIGPNLGWTSLARRPGAARTLALGIVALLAGATTSCARRDQPGASPSPDTIAITLVGRYEFDAPDEADPRLVAEELDGIVWTGGESYLTVGDAHACLYRLSVRVDATTGKIEDAFFGEPIPLRDDQGAPLPESSQGEDREGIALGLDSTSIWISNEQTLADRRHSSLEQYRLPDGVRLRLIGTGSGTPLGGFASQRANRGFESLARSADGMHYWTANETTLRIDGPEPSDSTGGVVRLQLLDASMNPLAQYAYEVDAYDAPIRSPFFLAGNEVSGVSDLASLPDGRLLVLERAFSGDSTGAANFRIRICLADVTGATDVSKGELPSGLRGHPYTPARKTLLWEADFGLTNSDFEGLAIGPALLGGDRLLLLVADNNGGRSEALYSLKLHVPPPKPPIKP
jgi:hypothetical protein